MAPASCYRSPKRTGKTLKVPKDRKTFEKKCVMLLQHARRNLWYPSIFKLWWFWSVGYIATIPLIGNMRKITGPLLLVTWWRHDFLLYRGSTVLQLSCPYPDFGAPQFPIPIRKSWCATLIWRKSKEGYRAPWLSKECIFFREDSGKSIAIGISLPWYAQDSRGGCRF